MRNIKFVKCPKCEKTVNKRYFVDYLDICINCKRRARWKSDPEYRKKQLAFTKRYYSLEVARKENIRKQDRVISFFGEYNKWLEKKNGMQKM
jgi:acetyl-CoA carboxylase beta subunit